MMIFNQCEHVTHRIVVNDTVMLSVQEVRFLGVLIYAGLSFNNHISLLYHKAVKHINVMSRLTKQLRTEAKLLLFKTFIQNGEGTV